MKKRLNITEENKKLIIVLGLVLVINLIGFYLTQNIWRFDSTLINYSEAISSSNYSSAVLIASIYEDNDYVTAKIKSICENYCTERMSNLNSCVDIINSGLLYNNADCYNMIVDSIMEQEDAVYYQYTNGELARTLAINELDFYMTINDQQIIDLAVSIKDKMDLFDLNQSAEQYFSYGLIYEERGEYENAYKQYEKISEECDLYVEAESKLSELIDLVILENISKAEENYNEGKYQLAANCISNALNYRPGDEELLALFDIYDTAAQEAKADAEQAAYQEKLLYAGKVFNVTGATITVVSVGLVDYIYPDSRTGYYVYYTPKDSNSTILDIRLRIKNTGTKSLNVYNFIDDVEALYSGAYKYTSYTLYYSIGNDIGVVYEFIDNSIAPLDEVTIHIAITLPNEVKTSDKSLTAQVSIGGSTKIAVIR